MTVLNWPLDRLNLHRYITVVHNYEKIPKGNGNLGMTDLIMTWQQPPNTLTWVHKTLHSLTTKSMEWTLVCSKGVYSSCFNSGTHRITFLTNSLIILERMTKNGVVTSKNGTYSWSSVADIPQRYSMCKSWCHQLEITPRNPRSVMSMFKSKLCQENLNTWININILYYYYINISFIWLADVPRNVLW